MCTARYAVSRPDAVDSGMSSAAAKRTSTGKETASWCRMIAASMPASAARTASAGTAYSISTKRTRRGETNTRCEVSE